MGTFIFLALVGGFIFLLYSSFNDQKNLKAKKKAAESFLIGSGATKWAFNGKSEYIAWTGKEVLLGYDHINRNDIQAVKIIKDGEVVFEKSTMGTAGRALVGGALLGGFGALVGASSGSAKGKQKVTLIELEIRTSSEIRPTYRFAFYQKPTNHSVTIAARDAEEWAALLETVIENNKGAKQ